ncbi:glycosyltransferase family 4 protein [Campylobacter sp. faydin G-24]|uniref:Glycosyltransferase family 4 protein n=1 Tax=Campylobacter anatolicus TaxID=2829105 RepID=A0ABS5HGP9_9BACT|nr:glycosyltransferase family 4 protein [Campylobacter anatolicus]MBR8463428.1 glycosyltransferase family 4 protein [Campylobacter anatolicus]
MKIVQILPELNEGGVERGTIDMNAALVQNGFNSVVISSGGKLVKDITDNGGQHIKLNVSSKNPFTSISRAKALKKALMELKPDIIHVRSRVPAWLVYLANKGLNFKVVSTIHGLNSPNFYSAIMTKADALICVSNCVKEHIIKHFHADESKISIIPRGVELNKFNPQNLDTKFIQNFRDKYAINSDTFVVSSVGRITELKDYETLIKAINELKNSHPIKVFIVGSAHQKKQGYLLKLKDMVASFGLENEINFTGNLDNIAEIYAISNVVVSSSKKPESFGRSVAEAIALNTPVVASNHGGVKDIIIKGVNGDFFEVGDFKELSEKILNTRELKFNGYDYIKENFSFNQMFEKTIKIYKDLYEYNANQRVF